jgi:hypothetical protein
MANVRAIYSVGDSLIKYLRSVSEQLDEFDISCDFALLSGEEIGDWPKASPSLTLYLYRVTMNEHLRNVARINAPSDAPPPLALDLHYLLTVWASSASEEHTILAWAMRELHLHETLSISDLSPEAGWKDGDVVQVIPAELSNEDLMRIWDSLNLRYRLSVSYIARVVRLDPDVSATGKPVVARRFSFVDKGAS